MCHPCICMAVFICTAIYRGCPETTQGHSPTSPNPLEPLPPSPKSGKRHFKVGLKVFNSCTASGKFPAAGMSISTEALQSWHSQALLTPTQILGQEFYSEKCENPSVNRQDLGRALTWSRVSILPYEKQENGSPPLSWPWRMDLKWIHGCGWVIQDKKML